MARCKYTSKFPRYFHCNEEAIPNDVYCILHADFPKDELELEKKINEKIRCNDFNFEGAKLQNIECNDITNASIINFRQAIVKENVKFNSFDPLINNLKVDEIDFRGASIGGNIVFYKVEVVKNVYFGDNEDFIYFDGSFQRVKVGGNVDFSYSQIGENVCFNNIKVSGNIDFLWAKICKNANFWNAQVNGNLIFSNAKIGGTGRFLNAIVGNNAYFNDYHRRYGGLTIKGFADFIGFKVKGIAFFDNAVFEKEADFRVAEFNKNVDFSETKFREFVNFKDTSFLDRGVFEQIKYFKASFENARLKNISFRNCDLTDVTFKNVIFENCELSTSDWMDKIPEHRDYVDKKIKNQNLMNMSHNLARLSKVLGIVWAHELIPDAQIAADTYRRIRQSLQQQGAYDLAGKFYVEEMNMKKQVYWEKNKVLWFVYTILSFTTGYGEKLANIFVIFIVYWIIYVYAVYSMPDNKLIIPLGSGILSIITALFVYVFARKMSR